MCASRPVSVRWAMKFGRDADLAFEEFSATGLAPFPYKQLKKTLKRQTLLNSSPRKGQSVDMRGWFASVLTKETKKLDKELREEGRIQTGKAADLDTRGGRRASRVAGDEKQATMVTNTCSSLKNDELTNSSSLSDEIFTKF